MLRNVLANRNLKWQSKCLNTTFTLWIKELVPFLENHCSTDYFISQIFENAEMKWNSPPLTSSGSRFFFFCLLMGSISSLYWNRAKYTSKTKRGKLLFVSAVEVTQRVCVCVIHHAFWLRLLFDRGSSNLNPLVLHKMKYKNCCKAGLTLYEILPVQP